jgi:hypothetical protein
MRTRVLSITALVMALTAIALVPAALADDDGDDDGRRCVTPPAGLVSWWPGDGHANDIADGNHGTLVGGAAYAPGKVGLAFSFDGLTGRVRAPEVGANLDGFSQLTLDAWIRPTRLSPVGSQGIVTKYNTLTSNDAVSYYLNEVESGKLRLAVFDRALLPSRFAVYTSNAPVVALGVFTHVAGVWSGGFAAGDFRLYMNGTEVPGTLVLTGLPLAMDDNTTPVNIGAFEASLTNAGPFGHFQGQIDEVEIFNRALTAAEIASIAAADSAGKCKPGAGGGDGDDDDDDDGGDGDDDDDDEG